MTEWTFLFSQLIHFLMEKKFSFFEKNISEAFEKVPPLCGSLLVYIEIEQGWVTNWGSSFDLTGVLYHLPYPVWKGIVYWRKNEKGWNHCWFHPWVTVICLIRSCTLPKVRRIGSPGCFWLPACKMLLRSSPGWWSSWCRHSSWTHFCPDCFLRVSFRYHKWLI